MMYVALLATVVLIVVATGRLGWHPFLVLLGAAYLVGLLLGVPPGELASAISSGFGSTLGGIGIVIAAGAVIGMALQQSGGANVLANTVIRAVGLKRASLALGGAGAVVSVPVFCDSGFVLLSPVVNAVARQTKVPKAELAVSTAMGLYATHVFVPPTPGPVSAAEALGASIPTVMLLGVVVSVPVILTTRLFAKHAARRGPALATDDLDTDNADENASVEPHTRSQPSTLSSFAPIVGPILLMALPTTCSAFGVTGTAKEITGLVGHPISAMIVGVVIALRLFPNSKSARDGIESALRAAGPIVLITGAGGALGGVLKASPLAGSIANALGSLDVGTFAFIMPFVLASALKTSIGSSTVAIVTTASLLTPFVDQLAGSSAYGVELVVLSIGAGAMTVSHANDSYFWVVSQFSGMSTAQAYRFHTVATLVAGASALASVLLLAWLL